MLAEDHFQNLLQWGLQCVCNMSGYKCVGSSSSPELWPDFMQEASNSCVWHLNDCPQNDCNRGLQGLWPDHLAQVMYRFKLGKGLVILLAIKLCIKHCRSSHATKFAQWGYLCVRILCSWHRKLTNSAGSCDAACALWTSQQAMMCPQVTSSFNAMIITAYCKYTRLHLGYKTGITQVQATCLEVNFRVGPNAWAM